jgi:hypothetical protein
MPDIHIKVDEMIVKADKVVIRFVAWGIHTSSFYGETPTLIPVVLHGISEFGFKAIVSRKIGKL